MKKIMTACALFACAFCARAYDVVAAVSVDGDSIWRIDIELANNDVTFTAFQMDITLDGEAKLKNSNLTPRELLKDHRLMLARPDGHYRVIGYHPTNANMRGKEGRLFSFTVDGDLTGITINKIIFAKSDGSSALADAPAGNEDVNKVVYDMEGRQVYKIDRCGICIQNGRKIPNE